MLLNSTIGQITRNFFPTVYSRINAKHLKLDFITTQYLLGHGNLKSYLFRFKISESDLCECLYDSDEPIR